jgi:hypothetical protein
VRLRALALPVCSLACACAEPDVDLRATVVVSTAPRLAVPASDGGPLSPSVGLLGEHVLLGWGEWTADPRVLGEPTAMRFVRRFQWSAPDGMALGPTQETGPHFGYTETWVDGGEVLIAQYWGAPFTASPFEPESRRVHRALARPGEAVRFERIRMAIAAPFCGGGACSVLEMPFGAGWASLPTTRLGSRAWLAMAYPPSIGGCSDFISDIRLNVVGDGDLAMPWSWLEPLCDDETWRPEGLSEGDVLSYWVFTTPSDALGALFLSSRSDGRGGSDGAYFYMRADPDEGEQPFRIPREPVVVAPHRPSFEDGHQPRATALGPRILAATLSHDTFSRCYTLRTFEVDGTESRETPWQLPCRRDASVAVHYVEMATVSGGALVVYSRRPSPSVAGIEDAIIEAVLVTPEGRRGSEILRVTPAEARAHPIAGAAPLAEGRPALAVESDGAVVAWVDARADAPGLYWRRIEVLPRTERDAGAP